MKHKKLANATISIICIYIFLGNINTFNFGSFFKGLPIKLIEFAMIINLLVILKIKKDIVIRKNKTYLKILGIWLIVGFLSMLLNSIKINYSIGEMMYGFLYVIRFGFYIVYSYWISKFLYSEGIDIKLIMKAMVSAYICVCLVGFVQLKIFPIAYEYYNFLQQFGIYILTPDPHIDRLISTYLDPNYLSSILVIPLNLCIFFILTTKQYKKYSIYIIIVVITQILTVSRSGLIGILISILIYSLLSIFNIFRTKKLNKRLILICYVIIMSIPVIIFSNINNSRIFQRVINFSSDDSAIARFLSWDMSIDIIKNNPIIGIGYNMLGFYTKNIDIAGGFGVDSSLLLSVITTGIIGGAIYITYYFKILIGLIKTSCIKGYEESNVIICIIIASLMMSFFNNLLFYPLWLLPVLVIVNSYFIKYNNTMYLRENLK